MEKRHLEASIENEQRELDSMGQSHRFLTRFTYTVLTIITAGMLLGAYWMLWPYQTVTKTPLPMHILEGYRTVRQGESVLYEYDYIKSIDVAPTMHRQFVDGLIFESTDTMTRLFPGSGHVHVIIPIPTSLPPGVYHIREIAEYRVNPIRVITQISETQSFTVLPAPGHADSAEDTATK